jgi:hypothetical protein
MGVLAKITGDAKIFCAAARERAEAVFIAIRLLRTAPGHF